MSTRVTIATLTDVGRSRASNEDALLVADVTEGRKLDSADRLDVGARGVLVAVSDGIGGANAGEVASAMALESLFTALLARLSLVDPDNRMRFAVEHANREVHEAGARPSWSKMGATLTAVLVEGVHAHIAQVGDSRAYVLREGRLRQVTEDQSYVQWLIHTGVLTPEQASLSPLRNVLLQAVGPGAEVKVALGTLALRRRDLLILCSDGLTAHLSDSDIREVILASSALEIACQRLVGLANDRGGSDNITVVLAGFSGDLPAPPPGERITDTYEVVSSFDPMDLPTT